ncbi:MAG: biopolymer transporter ExbD [Kiritimatiellaceae bacterium]|nr:biopolymer transporter ExbD [Kiritimatiellaceae bacterium]
MKFKIPMEGGDDEINMAPMIDMVFLLLIFFMVASHLTSIDRIPVALPVADESTVPKEALNRQLITLKSADESGEKADIYMNLQVIDIDKFTTAIGQMYEAEENLRVYLRADRYVRHKHIKEVMEACASVGISDIIFGTFESGN